LVAEPGFLPLGVLPGADADPVRHAASLAPAVKVFDRLPDADAVESRRGRRVAFRW
jgi:hypothetical protein